MIQLPDFVYEKNKIWYVYISVEEIKINTAIDSMVNRFVNSIMLLIPDRL